MTKVSKPGRQRSTKEQKKRPATSAERKKKSRANKKDSTVAPAESEAPAPGAATAQSEAPAPGATTAPNVTTNYNLN